MNLLTSTLNDKANLAYALIGGLAALLVVVGAITRGVRRMFRLIRRANETLDHLDEIIGEWRAEPARNGDPGRASMPVRIATMERLIAAHIQNHPGPGRAMAPRPRREAT